MPRYEVYGGRHDIPDSVYGGFEAANDQEAREKFYCVYTSNPHNSWDRLRLVEVVQERQERHIVSSDPDQRRKEAKKEIADG